MPQGQVLLVACSGAFLAFLDATIVNVAFPSIRESFAATSIGDLSWVLNAYNIVFAAFLVVFGRLADLLGRRRTFVSGVAVFTVASVACGLATSVEVLVAARVLQALGAALLVPASLALVVQAFEPERRGHAIGLWGATAAVAAGLGPPAGGALVELGGWRWAFLVNLPLGVAAVVAARRTLVESRAPGRRRLPDLRGAALLAAAVGLLNLGDRQGRGLGLDVARDDRRGRWRSLLLLGGFVLSSRHHRSPLLDPRAAAHPLVLGRERRDAARRPRLLRLPAHQRPVAAVRLGLQRAAGRPRAHARRARRRRRREPRRAGRGAPRRPRRRRARSAGVGGGLRLVRPARRARAGLPRPSGCPGQVLSGIGAGAVLPVLGSAAMAAVPGGRFATASAVVSSARQLGGVIGIAVLVVDRRRPDAADGRRLAPGRVAAVHRGLRRWWRSLALPLGRRVAPAVGAVRRTGRAAAGAPARRPAPAEVRRTRRRPGWLRCRCSAALSAPARARLDRTARTVGSPAGQVLLEEGELADSIYVLQSGRLEVVVGGRFTRELAPGAVLGELAVLTGGRRSATVRARRDATLLEVTAADFDALLRDDPAASRVVTAQLAQRLATPAAGPGRPVPARPAVVAVVPLAPRCRRRAVAAALATRLERITRVVRLDGVDAEARRAGRARRRCSCCCVATAEDGAWRDFALRQADHVVLVADGHGAPGRADDADRASPRPLLLVGARPGPAVLSAWTRRRSTPGRPPSSTRGAAEGVRALADRITGRAVGLVLAGGGARAFAHLGVLRELQEAGVVVDRDRRLQHRRRDRGLARDRAWTARDGGQIAYQRVGAPDAVQRLHAAARVAWPGAAGPTRPWPLLRRRHRHRGAARRVLAA